MQKKLPNFDDPAFEFLLDFLGGPMFLLFYRGLQLFRNCILLKFMCLLLIIH